MNENYLEARNESLLSFRLFRTCLMFKIERREKLFNKNKGYLVERVSIEKALIQQKKQKKKLSNKE